MTMTDNAKTSNSQKTEHFDVLIVGAGISGVGSAYHLQDQAPNKSYVILEKYETFGGTWHMHTYPGIRSDSDLYTFGYRFKPWTSAPIASADEIKKYMAAVISENNIDEHIRYRHEITAASWNSLEQRWTVTVTNLAKGDSFQMSANVLWMCQG